MIEAILVLSSLLAIAVSVAAFVLPVIGRRAKPIRRTGVFYPRVLPQ
jgi:hypothetical protein